MLTRLADCIERSERIDAASAKIHDPLLAAARPGPVRDLLSGTWLGHPLHPVLVATPIGLWTSAHLMDLAGQRGAARSLVGAGVLTALPAAATGLSDWADTTGAEQRIGAVHLVGNAAAMALYGTSWWARRRGRRGWLTAAAGAASATAAGWLGGHLAYGLGVGVDANAFDGGPTAWTKVRDLEDEPGDGLRSGHAGGVALLVAGSGAERSVLSDRCSHRGAPLSDGTVEDGCVVCPWHASRFDVATGEVRRGPAVADQPVYEHMVDGGDLLVRRSEPRTLRTNSARPG